MTDSLVYTPFLLKSIIDTMSEGVVVQDEMGKIVAFNQQACEILGLSENQLIGKTSYDKDWYAIKPDGRSFPGDEHPSIITLKTGIPQNKVQMGICKPNGKRTWICINSKLVVENASRLVFTTFEDITEWFTLNQKSESAKNNLETVVKALNYIVFELDANGTFISTMVGNEKKLFIDKNQIIGKNLKEIFPKDFAEKVINFIKLALTSESPQRFEYQNPLEPESKEWFSAEIIPELSKGEFVTLLISEITEKKKVLEKIQSLNNRLLLALRASGVGIWDFDIKNNKLVWDEALVKLYDADPNKLLGTYEDWKNRLHPDDVNQCEKILHLALQGEIEYDTEFRILYRDKSTHYIRAIAFVQRNEKGEPIRMIGTNWDITNQKITEDSLRKSEKLFRRAFNFSPTGIALVKPDGTCFNANPAFCKMLGYSKEELINMSFFNIVLQDDQGVEDEFIKRLISKEIETYQLEKRYIHKNGNTVWGLLSSSLVRDADNSPHFFIKQVVDITPTKKLFNELEQKNKVLETTTVDLSNKIRQLDEFNHIVAHNLRGPVGNINSLINFLTTTDCEEEKKLFLSLLQRTGSSLSQTLNDLMQVLEVHLNKDIDFQECSFRDIVERIKIQLQDVILLKEAIVIEDYSIETIQYPKAYLESILYNLLSNALKYSRSRVPPKIKISTKEVAGRAILSVEDNGLGLDLERHGRQIFKYKKVFHEGFNSSGVGLFITKNQIETFGGRISVESKPNEGSKFTITF